MFKYLREHYVTRINGYQLCDLPQWLKFPLYFLSDFKKAQINSLKTSIQEFV